MSHRVTWGAVEHDGPITLVQRRPATHQRPPTTHQRHGPRSAPGGTKGRLRGLPNTIVMALVLLTSGLAMLDLYLLVSSGLH